MYKIIFVCGQKNLKIIFLTDKKSFLGEQMSRLSRSKTLGQSDYLNHNTLFPNPDHTQYILFTFTYQNQADEVSVMLDEAAVMLEEAAVIESVGNQNA